MARTRKQAAGPPTSNKRQLRRRPSTQASEVPPPSTHGREAAPPSTQDRDEVPPSTPVEEVAFSNGAEESSKEERDAPAAIWMEDLAPNQHEPQSTRHGPSCNLVPSDAETEEEASEEILPRNSPTSVLPFHEALFGRPTTVPTIFARNAARPALSLRETIERQMRRRRASIADRIQLGPSSSQHVPSIGYGQHVADMGTPELSCEPPDVEPFQDSQTDPLWTAVQDSDLEPPIGGGLYHRSPNVGFGVLNHGTPCPPLSPTEARSERAPPHSNGAIDIGQSSSAHTRAPFRRLRRLTVGSSTQGTQGGNSQATNEVAQNLQQPSQRRPVGGKPPRANSTKDVPQPQGPGRTPTPPTKGHSLPHPTAAMKSSQQHAAPSTTHQRGGVSNPHRSQTPTSHQGARTGRAGKGKARMDAARAPGRAPLQHNPPAHASDTAVPPPHAPSPPVPSSDNGPPVTSTPTSRRRKRSEFDPELLALTREADKLRKREQRSRLRDGRAPKAPNGAVSLRPRPQANIVDGNPAGFFQRRLMAALALIVSTKILSFRHLRSVTPAELERIHNELTQRYEDGATLSPTWTRRAIGRVLCNRRTCMRRKVKEYLEAVPRRPRDPTPADLPPEVFMAEFHHYKAELTSAAFLALSARMTAISVAMVARRGCGNVMGAGGLERAAAHITQRWGRAPTIDELQAWKDRAVRIYETGPSRTAIARRERNAPPLSTEEMDTSDSDSSEDDTYGPDTDGSDDDTYGPDTNTSVDEIDEGEGSVGDVVGDLGAGPSVAGGCSNVHPDYLSEEFDAAAEAEETNEGVDVAVEVEEMDLDWNDPFLGSVAFLRRYVFLFGRRPSTLELTAWDEAGRPPLHRRG